MRVLISTMSTSLKKIDYELEKRGLVFTFILVDSLFFQNMDGPFGFGFGPQRFQKSIGYESIRLDFFDGGDGVNGCFFCFNH